MTKCPSSAFSPVMLFNGVVYGQSGSGDLQHFVLSSHDAINLPPGVSRRTPDKYACSLVVADTLAVFVFSLPSCIFHIV